MAPINGFPHRIYALGANDRAQLGLGHLEPIVDIPTRVPPPPPEWREDIWCVRGGSGFTLMLTTRDHLFVVGTRRYGTLGFYNPVKDLNIGVQGGEKEHYLLFELYYSDATVLCAAGNATAAVVIDTPRGHRLVTMGHGHHGELGRGPEIKTSPGYIVNDSSEGAPAPPDTGMLEDCGFIPDPVPNFPPENRRIVDLAGCMRQFAVVLDNGELWAWGKSRYWQLEEGTEIVPQIRWNPEKMDLPFEARRVVCGVDFIFVAGDPDEGLFSIFAKYPGKFLPPHKADEPEPVLEKIEGWKDIQATWKAVFILMLDGTIRVLGKPPPGQNPPPGLPLVDQIACGSEHIVVMTKTKRILTWGWSEHGNCGQTDEKWIQDKFLEITPNRGEVVRRVCATMATTFFTTQPIPVPPLVGESSNQNDTVTEVSLDAPGKEQGDD